MPETEEYLAIPNRTCRNLAIPDKLTGFAMIRKDKIFTSTNKILTGNLTTETAGGRLLPEPGLGCQV